MPQKGFIILMPDELKHIERIAGLIIKYQREVISGLEDRAPCTTAAIPAKRVLWQRSLIAVFLAAVVFTGWLLAFHLKNDVAPGGNKAILTLSNGSTVVLDCTGNGTIIQQGATNIVKVDNGKLAYNTPTTPAAGQFQLALPDGSKVWLNNTSSLRYPIKSRVTLVDVLGTSFNIAAYGDERLVKMTLLTGAVRVYDRNASALPKPGEQLVDADGVIAWKNGLFHFEKADVQTVMRQPASWYDVEVVYEGSVTSYVRS